MDMTLQQWQEAEYQEIRREYPDANETDCRDCVTLRGDMWFKACVAAASSGKVLTREVLDSMTTGQRYRIFHDVPSFLDAYQKKNGECYVAPGVLREIAEFSKRKSGKIPETVVVNGARYPIIRE